ncbi:MAG: hypothetical protein AAF587_00900 [Bacteroidota bacterium]
MKQIDRIFIQWEIGGEQVLRLLLSRSGSVNRMGDGLPQEGSSLSMCMGRLEDSFAFDQILGLMDSSWMDMTGRYELPDPQGTISTLSVGLEGDELDTGFSFTYGMDSEGPPEEFVHLVESAISITDPWYEEQIIRKKQRRKK